MRNRLERPAVLVATMALAGSGLMFTAPAAQAAPVFTTSTFTTSSFAHDDASCTPSSAVEQSSVVAPVTENGAAVSGSSASSVTLTAADPTDVMGGSASGSASGSVSSTGTNLKSIDHVGQGTVNVTSTKPLSVCELHMFALTQLAFTFTVTSPGFLTIDVSRKGPAAAEFFLQTLTPDDSSFYDEYGTGFDIQTSRRLYLPAGTYSGYTSVGIGVSDRSSALAGAGTAGIHATFALVGSQSAQVQGKAKKYVTFPTARACATHTVSPAVTGKKRRADQVKQVTFFVNDHKVKQANTPDKREVFNLPVADNLDADVRAVVKLFPRRPGLKPKVYEASASYVACSS